MSNVSGKLNTVFDGSCVFNLSLKPNTTHKIRALQMFSGTFSHSTEHLADFDFATGITCSAVPRSKHCCDFLGYFQNSRSVVAVFFEILHSCVPRAWIYRFEFSFRVRFFQRQFYIPRYLNHQF